MLLVLLCALSQAAVRLPYQNVSSSPYQPVQDGDVTFSWYVNVTSDNVTNVTCNITLDDRMVASMLCDSNKTCNFTSSGIGPCKHEWNVNCTAWTNESDQTSTRTFNVLLTKCGVIGPTNSGSTCTLSNNVYADSGTCLEIEAADLTLQCNGRSIACTGSCRFGILMRESGLNVQNCSVSGFDTGLLTISGLSRLTIGASSFFSNGDDGLHASYLSGLTISDSKFYGNGHAGIHLPSVDGATIARSAFNSNGDSGVYVNSGSRSISISSGNFTANNASAITVYDSDSISLSNCYITASWFGFSVSSSKNFHISNSRITRLVRSYSPDFPTGMGWVQDCENCGVSGSNLSWADYGLAFSRSKKFFVIDTEFSGIPCLLYNDAFPSAGIRAEESEQGTISNVRIPMPVGSGNCYTVLLNLSPKTSVSGAWLNGSTEGFVAVDSPQSSLSSSTVANVPAINVRIQDSANFDLNDSLVNRSSLGVFVNNSPGFKMMRTTVANHMSMLSPVFSQHSVVLLDSGGSMINGSAITKSVVGIYANHSSLTLDSSTLYNNSEIAVNLTDSGTSTISKNSIGLSRAGINAFRSTVRVRSNSIMNISNISVLLNLSSQSEVTSNTMDRAWIAVVGSDSSNLDVSFNNISSVDVGILLNNSHDTTMNKNRILNFDYSPPKYSNPELEPENILAAGIFASYSPRLVVSRNMVMENFWDGAVQLFDCPDSELWSNNFSMAGTCMSLFNCSYSSFYDNRFNDCGVFVANDSVNVTASVSPSGGTNILGCGMKGGNAWTSSGRTGISDTCENLDGDCFCDYPPNVAIGEQLSDLHPLAVYEGSDFTVRPDSMNGRALDSRARYDSKEYVAATPSYSQLITFSILAKVPGNYGCHLMPQLSGSVSLDVNETVGIGTIVVAPPKGEGCYPLVVNCSYSPAPTVSKLSKPAYFCVDRTAPTIDFGQRSQVKSRVYNPYDGEIVNSSTFTLNLSASDNNRHTFIAVCVAEFWNQTSSELMGNMSFEPTNSGASQYCRINVKLGNGEFRYRVFALDSAENYAGTGYRTVIVNGHPSGCDDCENVNNFDPSTILLTVQPGANKIKAVLYFDNASTGTRQPVTGAPIAVWIRNSTDRYLTKIVTDGQGAAYFDYSGWKDTRKEYSFIYCCFYEECGFEMCLNASGVDDEYRDANGIYSVDTIPTMPNQPEVSMERHYLLPALKKIDMAPDAQDLYAQLQQSLCIPIFILFGLLMGALYYTGRNPFGFLDLSPLRMGRHIRYSPRGMQTGFRVSAQTMAGVGTRVGSSAVKPMAGPTGRMSGVIGALNKISNPFGGGKGKGEKGKSEPGGKRIRGELGADGKPKPVVAPATQAQAKGPGFFVRFVKQTIRQESAPFRNVKNLVAPSAESKSVGLGSRLAMTLFGGDISSAGAKIAQGGPAKPVSKAQDSATSQQLRMVDPALARQFGMGTGAGAGWIGMLGFLGMRGAALSSLAGIVYQSMDAARKKSVAYGDTAEIEKQLGAIGVRLSDKQRSELGNLGLKNNRSITLAGPRGTTYIASLAKGGKIRVQEQASFSRQIFRFITALTGFSSLLEMKDTVKAVRLVNSIDREVGQNISEAKQNPVKWDSEQANLINAGQAPKPVTYSEALQMRYNQTNKDGSGTVSDNVYRVAQELLNQREYMKGLSFGRAFAGVFATTAVGTIFGTALASTLANRVYNRSMNEAQAEKIMRDAKLIGEDGTANTENIREFLGDRTAYAKKNGLYLGQVAQAFDVFSENFKKARQEATPVLNETMLPELLIKPELRLESSVLNASLVRSKASKPLISIINDIGAGNISTQNQLESKITTTKLNETEANFARISFSLMRQEPITIRQFEQLTVSQKALGIESPALGAVSSGLKKRVDEVLAASPAEQSRMIFEQESRSFLQSRGISYQEFQKASEALVQQLVTAGQAKADYSYPNEGARGVIDGLVKSISPQLDKKDSETLGRMLTDAANHSISEIRVSQGFVATLVDMLAIGVHLPETQRADFVKDVSGGFFRTSLTKDERASMVQELKEQGVSKSDIEKKVDAVEKLMDARNTKFSEVYTAFVKENPENLAGDKLMRRAVDYAMVQTKDEDLKLQAALHGMGHGLVDSVMYSTQSAKELSQKLTKLSGGQQYNVPPSEIARAIATYESYRENYSNLSNNYGLSAETAVGLVSSKLNSEEIQKKLQKVPGIHSSPNSLEVNEILSRVPELRSKAEAFAGEIAPELPGMPREKVKEAVMWALVAPDEIEMRERMSRIFETPGFKSTEPNMIDAMWLNGKGIKSELAAKGISQATSAMVFDSSVDEIKLRTAVAKELPIPQNEISTAAAQIIAMRDSYRVVQDTLVGLGLKKEDAKSVLDQPAVNKAEELKTASSQMSQKELEQYLSRQLSVERHVEPDYTSANAHMAQRMWNYGDDKNQKAALQNYLAVEWLAENAPNMAAEMLKDEAREAARKYMEKHASDKYEEPLSYQAPHSTAARIEQKVNQSAQTTSLEMAVDIALDNSKPNEKSEIKIRNNDGILEFLVPLGRGAEAAKWQKAEVFINQQPELAQNVLSAATQGPQDLFAPKIVGFPAEKPEGQLNKLRQMLNPESESAKPISISPQFHAQSYYFDNDMRVVRTELEVQYLNPKEPFIYVSGQQFNPENASHREELAKVINKGKLEASPVRIYQHESGESVIQVNGQQYDNRIAAHREALSSVIDSGKLESSPVRIQLPKPNEPLIYIGEREPFIYVSGQQFNPENASHQQALAKVIDTGKLSESSVEITHPKPGESVIQVNGQQYDNRIAAHREALSSVIDSGKLESSPVRIQLPKPVQYNMENEFHREALASAISLNSKEQFLEPKALVQMAGALQNLEAADVRTLSQKHLSKDRVIITENYTDKGEQSGYVPVRLEPEKITVLEGSKKRPLERDAPEDRFLLANLVKEAKPEVDVQALAERLKDRKLFNSAVEFVTAPEAFTINLSSPAETLAPVTVGKNGPVSNPESADYPRAGFNLVHGHKPSKEESAAVEQSSPVAPLYRASATYDSARLAYEYESEREKKRSYFAHMGIGSLDNEELSKPPALHIPDFEINMVKMAQPQNPKSRQPPPPASPSVQPAQPAASSQLARPKIEVTDLPVSKPAKKSAEK